MAVVQVKVWKPKMNRQSTASPRSLSGWCGEAVQADRLGDLGSTWPWPQEHERWWFYFRDTFVCKAVVAIKQRPDLWWPIKPGRAVPASVVETKRRAVSAMRDRVDQFRA
jgi:hypothetical protein